MKIKDLNKTLTEQLDEVLTTEMRDYIRLVLDNNHKFLVHNNPKDVPLFIRTRTRGGVDYKTDKMHLPVDVESIVDQAMVNKFGHPYRTQSLYTTQLGSSSYGNAYAVIPYGGDISYCYSTKIKDLLFNYMEHLKTIESEVYQMVSTKYTDLLRNYGMVESIILNPHGTMKDKLLSIVNITGDESLSEMVCDSHHKNLTLLSESCEVTTSIDKVISSMPVDYEIMIDAPTFLLINKKNVTRRFGKSIEDYLKRF